MFDMTHDDFLPFFPVPSLPAASLPIFSNVIAFVEIFRGLVLLLFQHWSINTHNRQHYTVIYAWWRLNAKWVHIFTMIASAELWMSLNTQTTTIHFIYFVFWQNHQELWWWFRSISFRGEIFTKQYSQNRNGPPHIAY